MEPKKRLRVREKEETKQEIPTPPPVSKEQIMEARKSVEEAFLEFDRILGVKRLVERKSIQEKEEERGTADNLLRKTAELDQLNFGEGTMTLCSINLREILKMRDRTNYAEYIASLAQKKIGELQSEVGELRKELVELQKELGIEKKGV